MSQWEVVTIGACKLYRGDCLEVLPTLAGVDVVVTDPPFGTGWLRGGGERAGIFRARRMQSAWDVWSTAWIPLIRAWTFAVFCPETRLAELLASHGKHLRYYIKNNPRPGMAGLDMPAVEPIVIWPRVRFSRGPCYRIAYNGDNEHPCQKPLAIMTWLVEDLSTPYECILDPFMGSGTTGLACVQLGRAFIGIEQDPGYFQMACRRIEAAYAQPDLFIPHPAPPQQARLFA